MALLARAEIGDGEDRREVSLPVMMMVGAWTTKIWSAGTCHRFPRFGDSSPKQGRVQRPGKQSGAAIVFDGDESPAESADKSAHSKARAYGAGRTELFNAHYTLAAIALIAGMASLQASEPLTDSTNLVIGLLVPPEEPQAASLRDGATLAVELANQARGPRVSLVIRGRTGQWGADGVEAARMVTEDGALGLIAPPDGAATHLVLQVSGRTSVPVISLCADSSVSQAGIPWMARIVPRTIEEAQTLFTNIHARRWVAVIPDARAGREVANDLKAAAATAGCSIEKTIEVSSSLTNAARLAKQILTNRPDAIALWLDPKTAGTLAKSLRASGFAGPLVGPGRLRSAEFSAAAGDALPGLVVPSPILEKDAATAFQHFTDAFRARFGREPDPTASASYDAATLLIHILSREVAGRVEATPRRSSVAATPSSPEMANIHRSTTSPQAKGASPSPFGDEASPPPTGVSGVLAFDSQGNRKVNLQLLEARSGKFISANTGSSE